MLFKSWALFLNMYNYFSPSDYLINSVFSVAVRIYKIHVFDEAFFFLTIRMRMVTKRFSVVTCCKELSLSHKYA